MISRDKNEAEERRLRAKTVGNFLKNLRQKSGLTQQQLASKLSYSTAQFVSNWERGISLPPLEAVPKLSTLCKTTTRALVNALFEYQEESLKMQKKRTIELLQKKSR
jgi:transcriptional regulator with XRE-family HTH domain